MSYSDLKQSKYVLLSLNGNGNVVLFTFVIHTGVPNEYNL